MLKPFSKFIIAAILGGVSFSSAAECKKVANVSFKPKSFKMTENSRQALNAALNAIKAVSNDPVEAKVIIRDGYFGKKRAAYLAWYINKNGIPAHAVTVSKFAHNVASVKICSSKANANSDKDHANQGSEIRTGQSVSYGLKNQKTTSFVWKNGELVSDVISRWTGKRVEVKGFDARLNGAGVMPARNVSEAAEMLSKGAGCDLMSQKAGYVISCKKKGG